MLNTDRATCTRLALLALIGAACLSALGGCAQPTDATWSHIQNTGILRVGMDASFPPFESIAPDGTLQGLDVDLAREISRRLELEPELVANLSYDGLYDALTAQRVDLIISALPVDPARSADFAYSRAYFNAGQVLVKRASSSSIQSMKDLRGHSLATVLGTEGDRVGRRWHGRSAVLSLTQFQTAADALRAVRDGEADAALVDHVSALRHAGEGRELSIAPGFVTDTPYACAVRRDSTQLLRAVDEALLAMEAGGKIDGLISKWVKVGRR